MKSMDFFDDEEYMQQLRIWYILKVKLIKTEHLQ